MGGVGNGVGGILSLPAENIPNREDELCAKDKLARDRNDWLCLLERLGTPNPVESLRDGVVLEMAAVEEASLVGEEGVVVRVAACGGRGGGLAKLDG